LVGLAVAGAVAGAWAGALTDLSVYQWGGRAVLDGASPYAGRDPATDLPFTYPPFASVLMVPLALLPTWLAAAVWTGASAGALGATVVVVRRALGRPSPAWLVVVLGVAALAFEPVWQNLAFGQVNLLLMLVVMVDALHPGRRLFGLGLGVAAGVKLTPLVLVVLLAAAGHRAPAARALLAFGATVAVGLVAVPGAASYWTDRLLDPTRVGPPALAHNQSVLGALTRLLDATPATWWWLVTAGPLAVAALLAGAVQWRRGDPVLGTCLGAIAMLLASPVAWSHHWVWAVPVALVLWEHHRWAAAGWSAVFVTRPILWPPWGEGRELRWTPVEHVVGNAYLLAALAVVVWASRWAVPAGGSAIRPARCSGCGGTGCRGRTSPSPAGAGRSCPGSWRGSGPGRLRP
jgi:alpha-1,2-mannosyltransferase